MTPTGMSYAELEIRDGRGVVRGVFRLHVLPHSKAPADTALLVDLRAAPAGLEVEHGVEPVQVLEGREYRYEIELLDGEGAIKTDRPEVFFPDKNQGETGRFRPGLRTGTMPIKVLANDVEVGSIALEVRSRKFDYLKHYRWMLRDLAEIMAEVVMERFAAAEQRFAVDDQRDAVTLYQRFVLLQSLLRDDHLRGALHHLLARPYVSWTSEDEVRATQRGVPSTSAGVRQLSRPGARVAWPGGALPSIPRTIRATRTFSSHDNAPNRFVKFALTRWRDVVGHIHDVLRQVTKPSAPIQRGIVETGALLDELDALLAEELFREVGPLKHFPASNQVLQKRAGYRAVFQAYVQFELASKISWAADDVYGAGQRDIATLYEYWVFLQLVQVVADLCDTRIDRSALLTVDDDGLSVGLRNKTKLAFDGTATGRSGRRMRLELHFNRSFTQKTGSWTRTMRPDCSLRIQPVEGDALAGDIWLHFDAKYRIEVLREILGDEDEEFDVGDEDVVEETSIRSGAKRDDLLKMHAYRDAIRRSAGAYVLYPGTTADRIREYSEILPGLGAFPLSPTDTGSIRGAPELRSFIQEVIDHASNQLTQHERGRFWRAESYTSGRAINEAPKLPVASFLTRPPADTLVLLGYVKNEAHLAWILEQRLYNLRADPERDGRVGLGSRELASDLVVLYGPALSTARILHVAGEPRILDRPAMLELGYPNPRGSRYFALSLEPVDAGAWEALLDEGLVAAFAKNLSPNLPTGAPRTTTWHHLATQATSH
ncbi:DUF2357 domain-containing protein [Lujinxingia sediminis]|uniref:DUF2357 domain-containing protein n=2 Tax=Lujinxingia sediminis TaxID=2480984 RepID=A0ABY0CY17_9DELT|nr:DUF2357 domain-containing protein [Lujinxingia sediminis]